MRPHTNRTCLHLVFLYVSLCGLCVLLNSPCSHAGEQTTITSDNLIYDQAGTQYMATGHVRVERSGTILEADEIIYNHVTADLVASGNLRYDDPDVTIQASRVEMNLETKSGTIYDAEIFHKQDNYRLSAAKLVKTGDRFYSSPEAVFTTCDPPSPAWCFQGKDINAEVGSTLTARNVLFRIRNIPVLYAPALWVPIVTERKSGFLFPYIGYNDSRGFQFTLPLYWVMADNQDATFVLDGYTKRGLGTGIEYQYVFPHNVEGKWWAYHIRDRELRKNYFEFRSRHDQRSDEDVGGYLSINFVNERDFYREYKTDLQVRTNRFLESTGEMQIPLSNSRAYLLSQYWIDLKENTPDPLQRLPEAGYVLNPSGVGRFYVSGSASIANFWREEGVYGQRADFLPMIRHAFGDDITILQSLGLRETLYSLSRIEQESLHREALEYRIAGHVRLMKKYASFSHILEPTVSYAFTALSGNDPPLFDSTELSEKTSLVELSLLNRMVSDQGDLMVFRLSQGFEARNGDRPFLPLRVDIGVVKPLPLRLGAAINVHTGEMEQVNSDIAVTVSGITFTAGQRYNRLNDINTYVGGIGVHPSSHLSMNGNIRYDAEESEMREIGLNITYLGQCWGVTLGFIKRPDDFSMSFLFELKGITKALKI